MPLEDIPEFLKIPQDERKAAWDKSRAARPLPAEPKQRPIPSAPSEGVTIDWMTGGAKDDDA